MRHATRSDRWNVARVNRLDVLVFFGSFLAGLALYFLLRSLGVRQLVVTLVVIAVMCIYAVTVAMVPRLRVRLDQAGDNAYYLGLLFTLTSMAVALYEFSNAIGAEGQSGAGQIIGNFGIALGTTITGIFLRILLNQMRIDPADVEMMTRIELSEAAKRVKATLDSVSSGMGLFLDETKQRTNDQLTHLVDDTTRVLGSFNTSVTAATKELTEATVAAHLDAVRKISSVTSGLHAIATEAERAVGRLRQVEPPPLELANRLRTVSDALEKVAGEAERVGLRLKGAGESSGDAGHALAEVVARLVDTSGAAARQQEGALDRIENSAERLKGVLDALSEAASRLAENSGTATRQQEGALNRIEDSATRLKDVLDAVRTTLEENRQRLVTLDEATARSAQQAQESQNAANKVLDSLVAITEGLTEFVSRKG